MRGEKMGGRRIFEQRTEDVGRMDGWMEVNFD
jgi:hypothetical protein